MADGGASVVVVQVLTELREGAQAGKRGGGRRKQSGVERSKAKRSEAKRSGPERSEAKRSEAKPGKAGRSEMAKRSNKNEHRPAGEGGWG